jgi:PAS domain S-box-containing protein
MTFSAPAEPGFLKRLFQVPLQERSNLVRYSVMVALVGVALLLQLLFWGMFVRVPYFLFWIAVVLSAWFGGVIPGLLAGLLSVLVVNYFFLPPLLAFTLHPEDLLLGGLFALFALFISWLRDEQQRNLRLLAQQREEFRVTLHSIGDGVIATDAQGRVTFLNPVAEALTGWRADEAQGRDIVDVFRIVNEETHQPVSSPVVTTLAQGVVVGLANHTVLIAKQGQEYPISDSGAPIHDANGEVMGAVLVFRDNSEQRQAETALRERELRLQLAVQTARIVAWEWNIVRNQVITSDNFPDIYGVSAIEYAEQGFTLLHPDDRARHQGVVEQAARNGAGYHSVFRIIRPDNQQLVWLEERSAVIKSEAGQPLKMLGVVQDITERKRWEQQLSELLQREQEARRVAEEANRLKLEFLAMVSHELRTPLTSIVGFASTLLAEDIVYDTVTQRTYFEVINQEAKKLTELVEQLLNLSSLQAGRLEITCRAHTLAEIVEWARPQLQALTVGHVLTVTIPPGLPPVLVDRQRIAQVLTNLVGNAGKYSPLNTSIIVSAQEVGSYVQVSVSDEGAGISPEERTLVFEAFRKARQQREGHRPGAGLGLAICKGIVEAHGGQIWIHDQSRPGTTISFTLPVADSQSV